jgi:hypothetical protein
VSSQVHNCNEAAPKIAGIIAGIIDYRDIEMVKARDF